MDSNDYPVHGEDFFVDNTSFKIEHFRYENNNYRANAEPPHKHEFYLVMLILSGHGVHTINYEQYDIAPNTFHYVSPYQVHTWRADGPVEGYAVTFLPEFFSYFSSYGERIYAQQLFYSFALNPVVKIRPEHVVKLEKILACMLCEYENKQSDFLAIIRAYTHIICLETKRALESQGLFTGTLRDADLVKDFRHLVMKCFSLDKSIQQYAEDLGTSMSHLYEVIKKTTGKTPAQIIREERVLEAKRLLTNSHLSTSQVGECINIHDPSYFSRFFRRETGLTPREFRIEFRKKFHSSGE
ncbi:MAG: helix-turn-helix domain-containing protein [Desulfovibrio sp.]